MAEISNQKAKLQGHWTSSQWQSTGEPEDVKSLAAGRL